MHGVDIGRNISHRLEFVQPAHHFLRLLSQNDGPPPKLKRPPFFEATFLLFLGRLQGLFERRINIACIMEFVGLENRSITL